MKKIKRYNILHYVFIFLIGILSISIIKQLTSMEVIFDNQEKKDYDIVKSSASDTKPLIKTKPKYVRGIHLTGWIAGSKKHRPYIENLLQETELNTLVIEIKNSIGEVFIKGVQQTKDYGTYVPGIPDLENYILNLKNRDIYTIARVVVFKDDLVPLKNPELAVKDKFGNIWKDRKGGTWLDPYNKKVWEYNIQIAEKAISIGFDEVQFDYIRFPSDGDTKLCRYSQVHTSITATNTINNFLKQSYERIKKLGGNLSIDVFGMTTASEHDLGIGQKIVEIAEHVDYISPMLYPSHYALNEFGIPDPNKEPYKTVYLSLLYAKRKLGKNAYKLRPYLQDFSLGYPYKAKQVLEQIQATYDNDIGEWLLWNPRCVYTKEALKDKNYSQTYSKSPNLLTNHLVIESSTTKKLEQKTTNYILNNDSKQDKNIPTTIP